MITLSVVNPNLPLLPSCSNSQIKFLSSKSAAVLPIANSKSRLKSRSSSYNPIISSKANSLTTHGSLFSSSKEEPVVVPIADIAAQPKIVSIARFDPQPVVPVVLPIPVIDAFPKQSTLFPELHFTLHNKLMLQPHQLLLNHSPISTTHHPNLYRHPFCFVGHGSYLIAGLCHNLVLVCFYGLDRSCPREALWNLDTNELKFLPEPDFHRCVNHHCHVTYTFIRIYGFGFDPLSKDYKVLRFVQFDYEDYTNSYGSEWIELYSLKTDSWKRLVTNSSLGHVIALADPSVLINGFYYWSAAVEDDPLGHIPIVLSFDIASEKLSHIPRFLWPMNENKKRFYQFDLVEFHGKLAALLRSEVGSEPPPPAFFRPEKKSEFTFEIWVWSGKEWCLGLPEIVVPATNIAIVVGLFDNDKLFLQNDEKELLLFDCTTRELENLGIYDDPKRLWFEGEKNLGMYDDPKRLWFEAEKESWDV